MGSYIDGSLEADTGFLLREAGGILGIPAMHLGYLLRRHTFSDDLSYRVLGRSGKRKRKQRTKNQVLIKAYAIPMLAVCLKLEEKMAPPLRRNLFAAMEDYLKQNWEALCADPAAARSFEFEDGAILIAAGEDIEASVRDVIRVHAAMNKFSVDPNVQNGKGVFKGSDTNAYEVAQLVKQTNLAETLKVYPELDREDVADALLYATLHPRRGRTKGALNKPKEELA